MSNTRELLLASASPRRQELLRQIGVNFTVIKPSIAEVRAVDETPADFVLRMAREKASAGLCRLPADRAAVVLAADTIVVLDDEVLGKPRDAQDAERMLLALSGRTHQVMTAIAVTDRQQAEQRLVQSAVEFCVLDRALIRDYWQTGEPLDKAGAYAIQGYGGIFVQALQGSYSAVVGLPLFETAGLLQQFGIACWQTLTEVSGAQQ